MFKFITMWGESIDFFNVEPGLLGLGMGKVELYEHLKTESTTDD